VHYARLINEGGEKNNYSVVTGLMMLSYFLLKLTIGNTINNAGHRERCFSPLPPLPAYAIGIHID